jgi:oxygen-independent coproporphyrinogen III oxidase
MAGIYVHIPFCRKACHYCDFHFSTSLSKRTEMVTAIITEIKSRQKELIGETIETIYFGGGTPSVLSQQELQEILQTIFDHYKVESNIELTLEANPDDCSLENLKSWWSLGINRLSIGVQSFRQEDLDWMNRSHNSLQAVEAILNAEKIGYEHINLDLIYGVPSMPKAVWESNVKQALDLPINHISAYSLTVEKGTALYHFIKTNKSAPLDEEKSANEYEYLQTAISAKGWEQYEISNYSYKGNYARHNTNYWRQKPYIGIGPSAHSFVNGSRRWNVSNNANYMEAISENETYWQSEQLTIENQINECVMLGLRTKWGVDIDDLKERFDYNLSVESEWEILELIDRGHAYISGGDLRLTSAGKLLADNIAATLFTIE